VAGYSAKPLWRKLGFDAAERVVLIDAPQGWRIDGAPARLPVTRQSGPRRATSSAGALIAFFRSLGPVEAAMPVLARRIFPDGALWVAWPRRAAGHDSDIREQDIRDAALPLGLVDVKVAALDENWSGLRLVWRRERRRPADAKRG
jgi:hypothetical protein